MENIADHIKGDGNYSIAEKEQEDGHSVSAAQYQNEASMPQALSMIIGLEWREAKVLSAISSQEPLLQWTYDGMSRGPAVQGHR